MITGKTKVIGIIGYPVEHSLSPLMHNAAFADLELDYIYVPLSVEPKNLPKAVSGLKAMGFIGANVTIPHKVAIMPYLDEIHSSAQLAGAVNTIVIKQGKCIGYNTDSQGFIKSITANNVPIDGKKAVVMGAGGASRAVVSGLIEHGIDQIMIGARNIIKAQEFVKLFPDATNLQGCDWHQPIFNDSLNKCDILINCTPIGMSSHVAQELPVNWYDLNSNAVVCDLIYNPPLTKFLACAQERGHTIINGEGMLIEQGALAFEFWTGHSPSRKIMCNILSKLQNI